jgi:adenylate cyclase
MLGEVGTDSHSEYRAVGDIVNTASRVQDINKQLGTRLLVSEDVLLGSEVTCFRRLGQFLLPGKGVAVGLCDRLQFTETPSAATMRIDEQFARGLERFRARAWDDAAAEFDEILTLFPADGPSAFYRDLCVRYAALNLPPSWDGTVRLAER